jgi:threonine dehydrogenase-like Zn-dependent dehydrogenase
MRANTWQGRNTVRVEDVPDPRILDRKDVVVQITSTAICGSDLHLVDGYVPTVMKGDVLGHEFMGRVVEAGSEVNDVAVGDRVVVPFAIGCGACWSCRHGLFSVCENSNPNRWLAAKLWGDGTGGAFGYSHLTGGYPGGQAQLARVPFADTNTLKIPDELPDERVLFLSDILPTGYMGAELAEAGPGKVIAIWGAGPVGQLAAAACRLLGADRIIVIDRVPDRLRMARERAGATDTIDYEQQDVLDTLKELTGGRGPDACIDAVGMEAHSPRIDYAYDRARQALRLETDRPLALREAIMACRNGGIVSVLGVYGGFIDKFPMGSVMNRGLTIRSGQTPVQRYWRPLLERIQAGELDPSFVITHRLPLEQAPHGYDLFKHKLDGCVKVVLSN